MSVTTILFLSPFVLVAAVGLGIGLKCVRGAGRAKSDLTKIADDPTSARIKQDRAQLKLLAQPAGRKRDSSIVGLVGALLRHADGSYTKAYHVQLNHTIFQHEHLIESRINELARLLATRKPPETVIQFRLSTSPDRGRAIQRHLRTKDNAGTSQLANLLHTMGVTFYEDAAWAGLFRQHTLSAWIRVPVKHHNDESRRGLGAFFPTLKREMAVRGKLGFIGALLKTFRETSSDSLIRRTITDERHSVDEAEKTFRLIEHQSPLKLVPFTRDELWEAVYLGHRQDSNTAPAKPSPATAISSCTANILRP